MEQLLKEYNAVLKIALILQDKMLKNRDFVAHNEASIKIMCYRNFIERMEEKIKQKQT